MKAGAGRALTSVDRWPIGFKISDSRCPFQEWNDMNLRWNASEFGGVKDLRIPPHRLWKPDVLMYNR